MISLDVCVSGGQLGRALADDPEELAYVLIELAKLDGADLGEEVAGYFWSVDEAGIVTFLRALAAKIEALGVQ